MDSPVHDRLRGRSRPGFLFLHDIGRDLLKNRLRYRLSPLAKCTTKLPALRFREQDLNALSHPPTIKPEPLGRDPLRNITDGILHSSRQTVRPFTPEVRITTTIDKRRISRTSCAHHSGTLLIGLNLLTTRHRSVELSQIVTRPLPFGKLKQQMDVVVPTARSRAPHHVRTRRARNQSIGLQRIQIALFLRHHACTSLRQRLGRIDPLCKTHREDVTMGACGQPSKNPLYQRTAFLPAAPGAQAMPATLRRNVTAGPITHDDIAEAARGITERCAFGPVFQQSIRHTFPQERFPAVQAPLPRCGIGRDRYSPPTLLSHGRTAAGSGRSGLAAARCASAISSSRTAPVCNCRSFPVVRSLTNSRASTMSRNRCDARIVSPRKVGVDPLPPGGW